jgi:predicted nuclease of predicted toxin-antitoxin system
MKIKLDENIPEDAATIFTSAGFQVSTVLDQGLGGKADPEVAAACKAESKVLITLDTDFANLGLYPPEDYSGIIVLRLANQAKAHVLNPCPASGSPRAEIAFRPSLDCRRISN